jgi:hypothetical protein
MAARQSPEELSMKNYLDLIRLRDLSINEFKSVAGRNRLPGMVKDLSTDEHRYISIYNASLSFLRAKGLLTDEALEEAKTVLTQAMNDSVFDT